MAYPASVDTFTPKVDDVDDVMAADVNELQTAITAVETELGTDPAGTAATLKARLAHTVSDAGYLEFDDATELTISSGAITVTQNFHIVDTEADAATDNLDTISGEAAGMVVILRPASSARVVTIRHNVGNVYCVQGQDVRIAYTYEPAVLIYDGALSKWICGRLYSGGGITGSGVATRVALYSDVGTITSDAGLVYNTSTDALTATGTQVNTHESSETAAAVAMLTLAHNTSGTAAAGFGNQVKLQLESTTTVARDAYTLETNWKTATDASRVSQAVMSVYDSSGAIEVLKAVGDATGLIINEGGVDRDMRVEGSGATNLLVVDAGDNKVQIGTNTAGVVADFSSTAGLVINEAGGTAIDFRAESDSNAYMVFLDASANSFGIGTAAGGEIAAFTAAAGAIFNEGGAAAMDFRVESDNYDALFIDSSENSIAVMNHASGKVGFFATAPATKQTALTTALTTVTHSAPGSPDYAIADLTNSGGYGFVALDEGLTVLSVIANLQTRVNELETKLKAYGLLA